MYLQECGGVVGGRKVFLVWSGVGLPKQQMVFPNTVGDQYLQSVAMTHLWEVWLIHSRISVQVLITLVAAR